MRRARVENSAFRKYVRGISAWTSSLQTSLSAHSKSCNNRQASDAFTFRNAALTSQNSQICVTRKCLERRGAWTPAHSASRPPLPLSSWSSCKHKNARQCVSKRRLSSRSLQSRTHAQFCSSLPAPPSGSCAAEDAHRCVTGKCCLQKFAWIFMHFRKFVPVVPPVQCGCKIIH